MNKHPKSGSELMLGFIESTTGLITEYKKKMKYCDESGQGSQAEKLHYTLRILQRYFNERGNMPV